MGDGCTKLDDMTKHKGIVVILKTNDRCTSNYQFKVVQFLSFGCRMIVTYKIHFLVNSGTIIKHVIFCVNYLVFKKRDPKSSQ